jgi:hypothetical protein
MGRGEPFRQKDPVSHLAPVLDEEILQKPVPFHRKTSSGTAGRSPPADTKVVATSKNPTFRFRRCQPLFLSPILHPSGIGGAPYQPKALQSGQDTLDTPAPGWISFHLVRCPAGPFFKSVIGTTIEEMEKIAPDLVAPMHCTGWEAMNRFSGEMPGKFVLSGAGTTDVFQA